MLKMIKEGLDPIQVGTECLGDGIWRACVLDQEDCILEVLGSASSAAAAGRMAYAYIIKKDLQGWHAQFPTE